MNKEIYEYTNYRSYLLDWAADRPKQGRGFRASLARTISCPISHISQVLSGKTHFTFEQAEEVNSFLGHTAEQAEYFLLLVQFSRAGTMNLRKRVEAQLKKIQDQRFFLKERLEVKTSLSREDQATFYSSWLYAATHILLTIKDYQSKEAIAKYFGISIGKTTEILELLTSLKLVQREQGNYKVGTARIHLSQDSPMIAKHHINWRLQAIQSLEREGFVNSLHYSSVVSISREDVAKIKSLLVKSIESVKEIIKFSKEEELHSFSLDFFKV